MPPPRPPSHRLEKLFHRRKCWMLDQLAESLGYALISVRRFLQQIGYCRSYTHNGKWYTLQDSPNFDRFPSPGKIVPPPQVLDAGSTRGVSRLRPDLGASVPPADQGVAERLRE